MVAASMVQSETDAPLPTAEAGAPVDALSIGADGALAMDAPLKGLSFQRRIAPAALGYPLSAYVLTRVTQRKLDQVGEAVQPHVDAASVPPREPRAASYQVQGPCHPGLLRAAAAPRRQMNPIHPSNQAMKQRLEDV